MITASIFFDSTLYKVGKHSCFICSAPCGEDFPTSKYIAKTFGNRDSVFRPSSPYLCGGCISSLQEKITIKMPDGEVRENQRVRLYSWIITKTWKQAYTKAHINLLREFILNPTEVPFAVALADSGQKHIVFRTRINNSLTDYTISLEEDLILVNKKRLNDLMDWLKYPISCLGKIAITQPLTMNHYISIEEKFGLKEMENIIKRLDIERKTQMFKLAVWLSPNKEECDNLLKG